MRGRLTCCWTLLCLGLPFGVATADEPNGTFFDATILPPGQLVVVDELGDPEGGGEIPDTVLGSRGLFGDIESYSDDDGPWEGTNGSALYGISTNSGSVDFAISGYPDEGFFGSHGVSGSYEASVTVYDFFGEPVDFFDVQGTLTPGAVDEYSFNDFNWLNGFYDVEVNNTVGGTGDVDFFTFTGLTPGEAFSAEVLDPSETGVDTVMAWYDETGNELAFSDDDAGGVLSLIEGVVPASGTLTFGVSGYPDNFLTGAHLQQSPYELVVTAAVDGIPGDFNGDLVVDAADYTVWRDAAGPEAEYLTWAANYGAVGATTAATPEPATGATLVTLLAIAAAAKRP